MPLVISKVNYKDRDLKWFIKDNPLNYYLYVEMCKLDDTLDFDMIFNEAYKICIRVYAEDFPEQYSEARFGLSKKKVIQKEIICAWCVALTILKYNYKLEPKLENNYSIFIDKVQNIATRGDILMQVFYRMIYNHFTPTFLDKKIKFEEKVYKFNYTKINSWLLIKSAYRHPLDICNLTKGFTQVGVMDLMDSLDNPREKMELLDFIEKQYVLYKKDETNSLPF